MLQTNDFQVTPKVCKNIDRACREVGFFYITGHGLDPRLCHSVLQLARTFFELSLAEKDKLSIVNSKTYRGYQKLGQNVTQYMRDWHEVSFAVVKPAFLITRRSISLRNQNQFCPMTLLSLSMDQINGQNSHPVSGSQANPTNLTNT